MPDMMETAEALGMSLEGFPSHYSAFFEASQQKVSAPRSFVERFEAPFLKSCNLTLQLEDDPFEALLDAAETIREDENLLRWAGFYHYLLYDTRVIRENPWKFSFPIPHRDVLGDDRDLFILLAQISGMDRSVDRYRRLGTPDDVIRATYRDVKLGLKLYREQYGHWGFRNHAWLTYHAHNRIYRLGRLEYIAGQYRGDVEVYRATDSGELLILAQNRAIFGEDGLRIPAKEEAALKKKLQASSIFERKDLMPEGYWMVNHDRDNAWLTRGEGEWLTTVKPDGTATRDQWTIDWDKYEKVLGEGSPVLTVHIPADGALDPEDVEISLRDALRFFNRKGHPTRFDAFVIRAWVLDPHFDIILSRPSNIRSFQDLFHLYPVPREEQSGLRAIYGPHIERDLPQDWPQETNLQRSLLRFRNQGYRHTEGGGFILRDELARRFIAKGLLQPDELKIETPEDVRPESDYQQRLKETELSG